MLGTQRKGSFRLNGHSSILNFPLCFASEKNKIYFVGFKNLELINCDKFTKLFMFAHVKRMKGRGRVFDEGWSTINVFASCFCFSELANLMDRSLCSS